MSATLSGWLIGLDAAHSAGIFAGQLADLMIHNKWQAKGSVQHAFD